MRNFPLQCASSTLQQDTCDFRPAQSLCTPDSEPADLAAEIGCKEFCPADGTSGMTELKVHSTLEMHVMGGADRHPRGCYRNRKSRSCSTYRTMLHE